MIRILHIVPTLGYGGVAKFLLHYYDYIDKSKIQFDFITHGKKESYHDELISKGARIFYIKPQHEVGFFSYYKNLVNVVKSVNDDIVHIHLGHHTGMEAAICKLVGVKKIICHAHTTKCMNPSHVRFMPLFRFLARKCSTQLFACGNDAGLYCFGTKKFTVIPNGVDLDKFKRSSDLEIIEIKRKFNIPENNKIIGCVAAMTPPKNHNYLLDVFSKIHNADNQTILMLVGDGELRSLIEKKIEELNLKDSVVLTGNQDNIPSFISSFDVFALTSHHEGLPVVSAEAQALGTKCVFSNNIDHTCDLGIGIMKFVPIESTNLDDWVKECLTPYDKPSIDDIKKRFVATGYEIKEGAKRLTNMYLQTLA